MPWYVLLIIFSLEGCRTPSELIRINYEGSYVWDPLIVLTSTAVSGDESSVLNTWSYSIQPWPHILISAIDIISRHTYSVTHAELGRWAWVKSTVNKVKTKSLCQYVADGLESSKSGKRDRIIRLANAAAFFVQSCRNGYLTLAQNKIESGQEGYLTWGLWMQILRAAQRRVHMGTP